jgi:hypothetical protein
MTGVSLLHGIYRQKAQGVDTKLINRHYLCSAFHYAMLRLKEVVFLAGVITAILYHQPLFFNCPKYKSLIFAALDDLPEMA